MQPITQPNTRIHKSIQSQLTTKLGSTADIILGIHKKIVQADSNGEISAINVTFYNSLLSPLKNSVEVDFDTLEKLDMANVLIWIAYTAYDNAIDDRDVKYISPANIVLRMAVDLLIDGGVEPSFINHYLDQVDDANSKEAIYRETATLYLHDLKVIMGRKSIAHCIGQAWILRKLKIDSTECFYHYCSARQLNDDLSDWREDLKNGHKTYTTDYIESSTLKINAEGMNLTREQLLNISFWQYGIEYICAEISAAIDKAESELQTLMVDGSPYVLSFLKPIGDSARNTLENHRIKKLEVVPTPSRQQSSSKKHPKSSRSHQ